MLSPGRCCVSPKWSGSMGKVHSFHSNRFRWSETHSSDRRLWESQLGDLVFKALVKAFDQEVSVQQSQSPKEVRIANSHYHWEIMGEWVLVIMRGDGVGTMPWPSHSPSLISALCSWTKVETWSVFLFKGCEHFNSSYDGVEIDLSKQVEGKQISCKTSTAIRPLNLLTMRHHCNKTSIPYGCETSLQ